MKERFAHLNAELVSGSASGEGDELIRLINENIKPPEPVAAQDILIRSMYIVSDEVNSYGGRFPVDEHNRLAQLLIDSPVLVGHRKDGLPIGRTFHASLVERNGRPWVRSYFYWLKSAEGAETLRDNIDKGVYKECSIGFTYFLPECSVCGEDLRKCRHNLFQSYGSEGVDSSCHFNYRKIERVLETSLVFRGATPGTAMAKELTERSSQIMVRPPSSKKLPIVASLDQVDDDKSYLVVPYYEGKSLTISKSENELSVKDESGATIEVPEIMESLADEVSDFEISGKLVAYRGKERRSSADLDRFLSTGEGPATRVVLYLYPDLSSNPVIGEPVSSSVRVFHHGVMSRSDLASRIQGFATKSGVEIWEVGNDGALVAGLRYTTGSTEQRVKDGFEFFVDQNTGRGMLSIRACSQVNLFVVEKFKWSQFSGGSRFFANKVSSAPFLKSQRLIAGGILAKGESGGYRLSGANGVGELRLQPVRIHGRNQFLFFQAKGNV